MARKSRGALPPLHPEGAPAQPGDEDLVIYTPDHRLFWLGRDEYRKHEFSVREGDLYDNLLRAGVVLAHLPPFDKLPKRLGVARCVCFLVNLASVRAQDAQKGLRRAPKAGGSASARKSSRTKRTQ